MFPRTLHEVFHSHAERIEQSTFSLLLHQMRRVDGEIMNKKIRNALAEAMVDMVRHARRDRWSKDAKIEISTDTTTPPLTPESLDKNFSPLPFGCEFTFIDPLRRRGKYLQTAKDYLYNHESNKYVKVHIDDGALEIPSPIFKSYVEAVEYWTTLAKLVKRKFGLVPWNGEDGNGGLHIRVDIPPSNHDRTVFNIVNFVHDNYRELAKFGEPGDFDSYKPLHPRIQYAFEMPYKKQENIVELFKDEGKRVIQYDIRASRCIEFRFFDSPKNKTELLLSLFIANQIMQKAAEPKMPYYFYEVVRPFNELIRETFKSRFARHEKIKPPFNYYRIG
jgi:hypothetical protein